MIPNSKPTPLSRFEQIARENQAAAAIILAREPEGQSLEAQWARAVSGPEVRDKVLAVQRTDASGDQNGEPIATSRLLAPAVG